MTLVEVLVASGLLLLALTVALSVLAPIVQGGGRRSQVQAEKDRLATALARIADDLAHSTAGGVYRAGGADSFVLGVARLEGLESGGARVWAREVVLYCRQGQTLVRKRWPPFPPTGQAPRPEAPPDLTPERLLEIADTPNGTEAVLAEGVRIFDASPPEGRSSPLRVTLAAEASDGRELQESWTVPLR